MKTHGRINVQEFYDKETFTFTYLVWLPSEVAGQKSDAVIIDTVLDYDYAAGEYSTKSVENVLEYIQENNLKIHYILETHAHADHLSGAVFLKELLKEMDSNTEVKIGIGKNITLVQQTFKSIFNLELETTGAQFDELFDDKQLVSAGDLQFKVLFTPGHTPACTSLYFDGVIFTGDALFMPDYGTGRCDFPLGSAKDLYHSIHNILYQLPDETIVYTGHDYCPGGRELMWETTIGASKKENIRLKAETTADEFIKFRSERDATLSAPRLLMPSIQVNINAGHLPETESNGISYLKIPIKKP